jgi:hypothetical protein
MPYLTPVDECCDRLRRAGWSFGWCSVAAPEGVRSLVDGHNGENALRADRPTLAEALRLACGQARAVGMLAPPREVVGLHEAPIPWPVGKKGRAKSLIVYKDLAKAVRRESA